MIISLDDLSVIHGALCDSSEYQRVQMDEARRLNLGEEFLRRLNGELCKTKDLRRIMADRLSAMERDRANDV